MYAEIIMKLVGGLGLFLYGMDNMSGGMQKIAGPRLKKILSMLTGNRVLAIVMGTFVTMLVQSSSVSTVMAIGFVNASLLSLNQALGLILGANIGTTITGWILVLKIGKYGLPMAGLGALIYLFSKKDKAKTKALTVMGLGLIFLGLELMSSGLKPIRSMPEFVEMFSLFTADSYFGAIKAALVGALVTMIVQSSSATLGITIALAVQGLIDYPTAVALVLGENVGTTITAILASLNANANAKRAAYAHTIINITGMTWAIAIFPMYLKFLDKVVDTSNLTLGIATAHTMFNVVNVLLFVPFIGYLGNFLCKVVKDDEVKQAEHITRLDPLMIQTPSIVAEQSKVEILNMSGYIKSMLTTLGGYYKENETINMTSEELEKLADIEKKLDLYQREITNINYAILAEEIDQETLDETRKNIEICDEYETISDYGVRIGKVLNKFADQDIALTEAEKKRLSKLNNIMLDICQLIEDGYKINDRMKFIDAIDKTNEMLGNYRKGREAHLDNPSKLGISVTQSTGYMDMLNYYKRLKDHAENIIDLYTLS